MRPIQREDGVHGRNGDEATDRSVSVRAGDITIGNENNLNKQVRGNRRNDRIVKMATGKNKLILRCFEDII